MNVTAKLAATVMLLSGLEVLGQTYFTKITSGEVVANARHSYGSSWADFDGDGWIDLFVANGWGEPSELFRNAGDKTFSKITTGPVVGGGGDSMSGVWADYDNDGDLDLFVTNFGPPSEDYFYRNNGDQTFTQVSEGAWVNDTGAGVGAGWGDYDNDGFLDLFVAAGGGESPDDPLEPNLLYHNNGNSNHWLLARLIGTVSNRSAIGAKVRARATIGGEEFWQLREISGGSGYCSQNDLRAHFGLGDAATVDVLRIEWPSGIVQELKDVAPNQILTVTEPVRLVTQSAGGFRIQCWINQSFDVQASTDLANWSTVATVTNTTGTLVFEDAEVDQQASRYYRVMTTP